MTTSIQTGIWDRLIADVPVAVIDFETTGLSAGWDRVVEVSVVRCDPGEQPRLVFDTLVHPERRMAATFVHGITDNCVSSAPKFCDVVGWFIEAVQGCVIASYNISFDIRFFRHELETAGIKTKAPHLCLMYMRPMLGFGRHCNLMKACRAHVVSTRPEHTAASDALAAACLWQKYRQAMDDRDIKTYRDLADLGMYRFVDSFHAEPFHWPDCAELARQPVLSRHKPMAMA